MALVARDVLAGGPIGDVAHEQSSGGSRGSGRMDAEDWQRDEARRTVCQGLEKVARQVGANSIIAGETYPHIYNS